MLRAVTGLEAVRLLAWAAFEDGAKYSNVLALWGWVLLNRGSGRCAATGGCHRAAPRGMDLAGEGLVFAWGGATSEDPHPSV